MIRIGVLILFGLLFCLPLQAEDTLSVESHDFRVYLGNHLYVYKDAGQSIDIEDALLLYQEGFFKESALRSLQYGYSDSAFWFTTRIANNNDDLVHSYIEVRYPPLDHIDVYLINASGQVESHTVLGDQIPYYDRLINSRIYLAELELSPKSEYQVYIRVQSKSSLSIPIYLSSLDATYQHEHYLQISIGMFYGLALGLFFYNLFLYIIIKDPVYLYYITYVLGYTLFMANIDGLLFQFWPNAIDWESRSIYIFPQICGIFLSLFCRTILQTKYESPLSDLVLKIFFVIYLVCTVLFFFIDISICAKLTSPIVAVNALCILGITFVRLYQGHPAAFYFVFGMGGFCIGLLSVASGAMNLHENYDITPSILKAGASLEMVMFSIALAQRVSRLKEANKIARIEQLKRMDKLKDDFLANTSHELRTPLNAIIGIADSMLGSPKNNLDDKDRRNLSLISSSGYRLANLVNDILDFSKIKKKELALVKKPVSLRSLVDTVIELSKPLLREKPVTIVNRVGKSLPLINADEDRIYQILHNLIANSIKFTEVGEIVIKAEVQKENMIVSVSDTGIGIPKEHTDSVFRAFEQADSSIDREFGGTGLGLAITKQLVELHGGKIWLESEPGEGTCFYFTLPEVLPDGVGDQTKSATEKIVSGLSKRITAMTGIGEQEEQINYKQPNDTTAPPVNSREYQILIVDDDPVNLEVLNNQLALNDYRISSSNNGIDALKMIHDKEFDLVLLDVMMPGMSGYEVCERIRKTKDADRLPVIMITAKNQVADLVQGFAVGANDYIAKPFVKDELLARVTLHLKLKDAVQAVAESEKKYRNIFEEALEGIFQLDERGRFIAANPAMAKILGYEDSDELKNNVGYSDKQIFADPNVFKDLQEKLELRSTISQYETEFIRRDGSRIWGSIKISKVEDSRGQFVRYEGLLEDITDQKESEAALYKAYQDVELKVEERTKELIEANNELQVARDEANAIAEAKAEFIANMSHEIRTPMNGVIAAADLALELNQDEKVARFIGIIKSSGYSLLNIINGILDLSKLEAKKLEIEQAEFDIQDLLDYTGKLFGVRLADKEGVELLTKIDSRLPKALIGDKNRLQQVLTNLVGNAVKFTEKGYVLISIELERLNEGKADLKFRVQDTGPGMSEEYLADLFEPFSQGDSSNSKKLAGTGLGMTISKMLVELMGGAINASSELGQGTTVEFNVSFPIASAESIKCELPKDIIKRPTLAIVPTSVYGEIIHEYLTSYGYRVDLFSTLLAARHYLEGVENTNYGMVLIDSDLKGFSGLPTINEFRNRMGDETSVIVLKSYGVCDDGYGSDNMLEALYKPFGYTELFNTIEVLYGLKKSEVRTKRIDDIDAKRNVLADRKVLLAEDNVTNKEIAVAMLKRLGLVVDTVDNGAEAVNAVYEKAYDVVLMDIEMPELNGYDATRKIRSDRRFSQLPIIAMTAHALIEQEDKGFKAGMSAYLTKPINLKKLEETLVLQLQGTVAVDFKNPTNRAPTVENEKGLININRLMEEAEIDIETIRRIFHTFDQMNIDLNDKVMDAFNNQDVSELKRLMHGIKGSAGNIGAHSLKYEAEKIEVQLAEKFDSGQLRPLIIKFQHVLDHTIHEIRKVTGDLKSTNYDTDELPGLDNDGLVITLTNLKESLDSCEPSKIKKYFTELMALIGSKRTHALKTQIDSFKYMDAAKELQLLATSLGVEI